jgi:hypothetical protein
MTTAPPQTASAPRPRVKKSLNLPSWAYYAGVALLLVVFLLVVTLLFGRVSGEEFSPYEFKRRTFHFYELPFVRLQVWPVKRFDTTGDIETMLVTDKILTPQPPATPRWDLVRGYRGSTAVAEGDANILCRYLDRSEPLLKWMSDHPKPAKVFWPIIARLAEQELYIFMPDTFELALAATDEKKLERELNGLLAKKYHDFGLVQQKLGYHALAVELLTEAIKLAPQEASWQLELEESRKQVPKEP